MTPLNIVFDFGAVLFGWEPHKLVREYFPALITSDDAAWQLARSIFHHADWQSFDAGLLTEPETVQRLQARTQLPLAGLRQMVADIGVKLPPLPESIALLAQLRTRRDAGEPIELFFLSNMPEPYARVLEKKHDFIGWFKDGIFSGDVKLIKPDAAIYQLCDQRFGIAGQNTLFIDDSLPNVQAARAHGWRAIHLPQPEQLQRLFLEEAGL
jgi:putative hydrolase of the HAD superfamily